MKETQVQQCDGVPSLAGKQPCLPGGIHRSRQIGHRVDDKHRLLARCTYPKDFHCYDKSASSGVTPGGRPTPHSHLRYKRATPIIPSSSYQAHIYPRHPYPSTTISLLRSSPPENSVSLLTPGDRSIPHGQDVSNVYGVHNTGIYQQQKYHTPRNPPAPHPLPQPTCARYFKLCICSGGMLVLISSFGSLGISSCLRRRPVRLSPMPF